VCIYHLGGLALGNLIPGNVLTDFLYRHGALCRSRSDELLYGTANVENGEQQTGLPWMAQHTDDVGLLLAEFKDVDSICNKPRLCKRGLIVTTYELLDSMQGLQGHTDITDRKSVV